MRLFKRRDKNLERHVSKDYDPGDTVNREWPLFSYEVHRPIFARFRDVPPMLRDSRIKLGMAAAAGAILAMGRIYVDEGNQDAENINGDQAYSDVKQFAVDQIKRWWFNSSEKMLSSMAWGYFAGEVFYRRNSDGDLAFDFIKEFRAQDAYPVAIDNEFAGIELSGGDQGRTQYVGGDKAIWHVHKRHVNRWWGESRLLGAYDSWLDLHEHYGALHLRRLYYKTHVLHGWDFYYDPGRSVQPDGQGGTTSNRTLAINIIAKARSGAAYLWPAAFDATTKQPLWGRKQIMTNTSAGDSILEYIKDLRTEMMEGLEVPEEVIMAAETGSGFSGRAVPQKAFHGLLKSVVYWMANDFDSYILQPLMRRKFGTLPDYQLVPFGLVDDDEEQPQIVDMDGQDGAVSQETAQRSLKAVAA